MVGLPYIERAYKRNVVILTERQGKTKRGRRIEDENNEEFSKTEIERKECSIWVLNRGENRREERCLGSTQKHTKAHVKYQETGKSKKEKK